MQIEYRGEITPRDYMRGFGRHYRPTVTGLAMRAFALAAVLAGCYWMVAGGYPAILVLLVLLVAVAILGLPWWIPALLGRRAWAAALRVRDTEEGAFTPEGIVFQSPLGEGRLDWTEFRSYRAFADLVLLYQRANVFNIVPRTLFASDGDWIAALELVKAALPEKSKSQRPRWGLWVALLGLAGLVAATLLLRPGG